MELQDHLQVLGIISAEQSDHELHNSRIRSTNLAPIINTDKEYTWQVALQRQRLGLTLFSSNISPAFLSRELIAAGLLFRC